MVTAKGNPSGTAITTILTAMMKYSTRVFKVSIENNKRCPVAESYKRWIKSAANVNAAE